MGTLEKAIISLLTNSEQPLTLPEIAKEIGKPEKAVFKSLRKLFEREKIVSKNRRYKLAEE